MWTRGDTIAFIGLGLALLGTIATILVVADHRARRALFVFVGVIHVIGAVAYRRVEKVLNQARHKDAETLRQQELRIEAAKEQARQELVATARERVAQQDSERRAIEQLARDLAATEPIVNEARRRVAYEDAVREAVDRIERERTDRAEAARKAQDALAIAISERKITGRWSAPGWFGEDLVFSNGRDFVALGPKLFGQLHGTYRFLDATHIELTVRKTHKTDPKYETVLRWEVHVGNNAIMISGAGTRDGIYERYVSEDTTHAPVPVM
jgi:hypothetical protein